MEKEKQIEEMAKLMFAADCSMCVSEACPAFGRGILKKEKFTCNNYLLAKALYDAGYGNVKEAAREAYKQARKETFMEIMETLRFGYELPIDDIAREMAKEYGVEVYSD